MPGILALHPASDPIYGLPAPSVVCSRRSHAAPGLPPQRHKIRPLIRNLPCKPCSLAVWLPLGVAVAAFAVAAVRMVVRSTCSPSTHKTILSCFAQWFPPCSSATSLWRGATSGDPLDPWPVSCLLMLAVPGSKLLVLIGPAHRWASFMDDNRYLVACLVLLVACFLRLSSCVETAPLNLDRYRL